MREISDKETFHQVYNQIKEAKTLKHSHEKLLTDAFGDRFKKAYNTVMERKVKKYIFYPSGRVVWTVAGKEREYLILQKANFCPCDDFYFRVIGHEVYMCYHLLAQKLAELLNTCVMVEEKDEDFSVLMEKWRSIPLRSRALSREEMENIRSVSFGILSEVRDLSIRELLEELNKVGFSALSSRHLATILTADSQRRFRCFKGRWSPS